MIDNIGVNSMNQVQCKLSQYPDWDRDEQIKRNHKALEKLEKRRKLRLEITEKEEHERIEFFQEFQQLIDSFRPQEAKLYNVKHLGEFAEALAWEDIDF